MPERVVVTGLGAICSIGHTVAETWASVSKGICGAGKPTAGFTGTAFSVASACAAGADGIGLAWLLLRAGTVDAMIAGAAEASIDRVGIAALDRTGAMSHCEPGQDGLACAPQPFDRNRDGLVMGNGYHITSPVNDGSGGARAIRLALETAQVNPDQVDYINAHGTATRLNDMCETRAIKSVFGSRAYHIPVSSTKSMTGHMMGATGALEAVLAATTRCLF